MIIPPKFTESDLDPCCRLCGRALEDHQSPCLPESEVPESESRTVRFNSIFPLPDVDELSVCDSDVRAVFEGHSYIHGMPLMAQLIKEIRLLREALSERREKEPA